MIEKISIKDRKALFIKAADIISSLIGELSTRSEPVLVAAAGGRSVAGVFAALREKPVDWSKVHFFMADERVVPAGDKNSNFRILKRELIDKISIPMVNVHPFLINSNRRGFGARRYEEEFRALGERFDLVLLSSGEDGHVASLFPFHHSVRDNSEFFIVMDDSPKPPRRRISISRKLLLRSRSAIIMFVGEEKRDALDRFGKPDTSFEELPAVIVKSMADSCLLTDII
ncbi:MAG: 6-phosphogluconolactonase [Candidatus Krumholzibacteriales bacterium]